MPSVSRSRDQRRKAEQEARSTAEAEASLDRISSQLNSWTSQRFHSNASSPALTVGGRTYSSPLAATAADTGRRQDDVAWMNQYMTTQQQQQQQQTHDGNVTMMDVSSPYASDQQKSLSRFAPTATTTPAVNRGLERADTPVHSNAKKGMDEQGGALGGANSSTVDRYSSLRKGSLAQPLGESGGVYDLTPSPNVPYTPAPLSSNVRGGLLVRRTPLSTARRGGSSEHLTMEARHAVQTSQQYHDALHEFLKAKQLWLDRYQIAENSASLEQQGMEGLHDASSQQPLLREQHTRLQVDFLQRLASICYEHHHHHQAYTLPQEEHPKNRAEPPSREGNFWNLLGHLRHLGMDALLWQDSANNAVEAHHEAHMEQLQVLAEQQEWTPRQVLHHLKAGTGALPQEGTWLIQRRYQLLDWLQSCFLQELPLGWKSSSKENSQPPPKGTVDYKKGDSELYRTQGLVETTKDATLLQQALALILAGQLPHAQDLMRANGLSWRSASWSGGAPAGFEDDDEDESKDSSNERPSTRKPVGNPTRSLWQRAMWGMVQDSTRPMHNEEKAIASLLCNHHTASFDNPALRTWEKGLYIGFKAMIGRTEDVLLYQKASDRYGQAQLEATKDIVGVDEKSLIESHLANSPHREQMEVGEDLFATATAAFLMGQTSILALLLGLEDSIRDLQTGPPSKRGGADYNTALRFATHLVLYLDSTATDPSGSAVQLSPHFHMEHLRDRMVVSYLNSLAERELWGMMVLYASFLQFDTLMLYLPPLLVPVVNEHDRRAIVSQLQDLQPEHELDILRAVVKHYDKKAVSAATNDQAMAEEEEEEVDEEVEILGGGDNDERMMNALLWLCMLDSHAHAALVYSNSLVCRFLLEHKLDVVFRFVEQIRPKHLLELIEKNKNKEASDADGDENMEEEEEEEAVAEYEAYESYLHAERIFTEWRKVLDKLLAADTATSSQSLTSERTMAQFDEVERGVAINRERLDLVGDKQAVTTQVISAADSARQALLAVLQHPGGWLWREGEGGEQEGNMPDEAMDVVGGIVDVTQQLSLKQNQEWEKLRKQVLPHASMLHGEVCQVTADWMADSLQHVTSRFNDLASKAKGGSGGFEESTMASALAALDPSVAPSRSGKSTPVNESPFSPIYWTTKAMELADILASDEYKIPLHEPSLEHISKITVVHLQYSADLGVDPSL